MADAQQKNPRRGNAVIQANGGLNPKQLAFVNAYIVLKNATQAAIKAGYSKKTAHSAGPRMLENVAVAGAIVVKGRRIAEKYEITSERVLAEYARIAYANMLDFIEINEDGTASIDFSKVTREQAAAMGEVVTETHTEGTGDDKTNVVRVKFKLHDKIRALEALAKHLKLFPQNEPNSLAVSLESLVSEAMRVGEARAGLPAPAVVLEHKPEDQSGT